MRGRIRCIHLWLSVEWSQGIAATHRRSSAPDVVFREYSRLLVQQVDLNGARFRPGMEEHSPVYQLSTLCLNETECSSFVSFFQSSCA